MTKPCEACGSKFTILSRYCGATVCEDCGHHNGLARCYCGWAASGGNGRDELVEMGEVIGDDEPPGVE
jgi:hypothetical protein